MLGEATADWQSKRREAARQEILSAAWAVARENGLAALTLREVAARVGMRAPSLYSHFSSKNAIYDAMFGQAWRSYEELTDGVVLPAQPRAALRAMARRFFEFAVADLPRNQLMNQRTIPGFTPSPESYAPAVRVVERLRSDMAGMGITDDGDVDLFIALVGGLADAQWANDPGGTRYARLLDRAVDMYADALHLPQVDDDQEET
ncbi:TetR family transcriptional regulator [Pseudonocardia hierapolitana]|uniref:TetR family transcriptional regulator n=1 Tax=Pseudonocardia hierapolitana TaxID=1128676 RepID=A0A561SVM3_9PSEU|nr:TetR/AcrR family transcriptional regulator [Pseudonocardia hierapolitana]TWF78914.1 TetR family transcriptional regulator [Pseudonocardia hierapolitana]